MSGKVERDQVIMRRRSSTTACRPCSSATVPAKSDRQLATQGAVRPRYPRPPIKSTAEPPRADHDGDQIRNEILFDLPSAESDTVLPKHKKEDHITHPAPTLGECAQGHYEDTDRKHAHKACGKVRCEDFTGIYAELFFVSKRKAGQFLGFLNANGS
jgi:hypothetical protein